MTALVVAAIIVLSFAYSPISRAAGNILYVTPSSTQVNINGSFNISIRGYVESSGSNGTVSGTLTYPKNLLRVTGTPTSGSAYGNPTVTQNAGNGTISFSGSQSPGPSGQVQIFSVSFQAIAAGSATVGFTGDSNINSASTTRNTGTYTITDPNPPPATCPAGQTGTPPNCKTPAPATCPSGQVGTPPNCTTPAAEPTPSTPAPANSDQPTTDDVTAEDSTGLINTVNIVSQYTSSSISWKINAANGTTELLHGKSSDATTTKAEATKASDGTYTATINNLQPGTRHYFTINGTSDSKKPGAYSGVLTTRGYPVKLTITQNGTPSGKAKVKIGQQSYSTSTEGTITLSLAQGNYSGTATTDSTAKDISFSVAEKSIPSDGSAPELQSWTFDLPTNGQVAGSQFSVLAFVGVLLVGGVILVLGFVIFLAIRRRRFESENYSNPAGSVVIEDGYDWRSSPPPGTPSSPYEPLSAPSPQQIPLPSAQPSPGQLPPLPPLPHNNSVYINEEEPLDMFDLARQPMPPAQNTSMPEKTDSTSKQNEWPQNPNPPHSTTP